GKIQLAGKPPKVQRQVWPVVAGSNPCPNPSCISRTEPRHVTPKFTLRSRTPLVAHCAYCSRELVFRFVGCSTSKHYHAPDSRELQKVLPDHLVFLPDEGSAQALAYSKAHA
ncbi:MAG TPA: hypothetical protein P5218_07205, partial [Planctomycetota bacterium]|nr:hypothetical protein [Planctomycetota bacterium]